MSVIYKRFEECNPHKKCKILIVFDNMIADMFSNKKLNPIVTELFVTGRKLNISFGFIAQSYFDVPNNIGINSTHYYEISKQMRVSTNSFNHSSDIDMTRKTL